MAEIRIEDIDAAIRKCEANGSVSATILYLPVHGYEVVVEKRNGKWFVIEILRRG